jgi:hypothetical protein
VVNHIVVCCHHITLHYVASIFVCKSVFVKVSGLKLSQGFLTNFLMNKQMLFDPNHTNIQFSDVW